MDQTSLPIALSGFQRLQLTNLWIKKGREGDKEDFIKRICAAKKIEYTPPPVLSRTLTKT